MSTASESPGKFAYATLVTRASYLAGVIILAFTLRKHGSQYPLVVLYPSTLKQQAVRALEIEAPRCNLNLRKCEILLPPNGVETLLVAERFKDVWTKLRVFELVEYDIVCYLDADIAIFNKNMDSIFELGHSLPTDWIGASHACVCNKEKDPWPPEDWTEQNCAFSSVSHPDALTKPTPVTPESRPTYHLFNSGLFIFRPSHELSEQLFHFFNTTPLLSQFRLPDQQFLATFFRNKWRPVGWQYNALKRLRYWHRNIWRDDEVICLHYIIDKPWTARIKGDGTAGYNGNDGVTHSWWWKEYEAWQQARLASGDSTVLQLVGEFVAAPAGESETETDADMLAIGANVRAYVTNQLPSMTK